MMAAMIPDRDEARLLDEEEAAEVAADLATAIEEVVAVVDAAVETTADRVEVARKTTTTGETKSRRF